MAYARLAGDPTAFTANPFRPKPGSKPTPKAASKATPKTTSRHGRGFFRRAFDAMVEARRHAAEREIAAFVERSGGKFTDDAERGIDRILSASGRF